MSDDNEKWEAAQDRLAGADPATGAPDPRIDAIRATVMAEAAQAPNADVIRLRRRRRFLVAGSIAAGVALLAGTAVAGAAVGRSTAPTVVASAPQTVTDQLPVVGDEGDTTTLPVVGVNRTPMGGMAGPNGAGVPQSPGAPASTGGVAGGPAVADKMMAPVWGGWGASLVPVPDLVDDPGTATGYRLVSQGIDLEALAQQLANTFDVKGKPENQDGMWWVGAQDGTKPSVWVYSDTMASWSFSDPTQNPYDCATPVPVQENATVSADATASSSGDGAGSVGGSSGTATDECKKSAKPMSEKDALKLAKGYLAALGITDGSTDGIDVQWETSSDDYATYVTAWQRVDGNRTQLSWSFTFGADSLAWANGFAAGLEPIPAFPVIGAKSAVLRSQDPKWSAFGPTPIDGGVVPMGAAAKGSDTAADGSTSSSDSATASSGGAVSPSPSATSDPTKVQVWWDPITVTGAEATLAQYWQPDGTMLLLPAYRLTTADDRGTWAVISVDESAVDFVNR